MNPRRVVVALSGGVDSAVAAARLLDQGYQVTGVTTQHGAGTEDALARGISQRAQRVADALGIPLRFVDVRDAFERWVVEYLVSEYAAGRTPNPCVVCNRVIRFQLLLERVLAEGVPLMATGHYARIRDCGEAYQLLRGRDARKDQSYFLHTLTQYQLAHVLFPLGDLTKQEVRAFARRRRLPAADQAESQDICFLAGEDYRSFIRRRAPALFQPGPIVDRAGRVLGQHGGLPAYTIGQRKGLGISAPHALYVLAIRPSENALVVGPAEALGRSSCRVAGMHYIAPGPPPETPFRAEAQIRYRARPIPVTVTPLPRAGARVRFDEPQSGVTPGQFLVLYRQEVVLGGGTICTPKESML
jgi:tRNA-specific 2-thiouridylase